MAHGDSTDSDGRGAISALTPLLCPACGGANVPRAVFCANPACHKALSGFAYVRKDLKK